MKTTNMNNTNTTIEATASDIIYIATQVRTEVWEERTEIAISAFECTDMATINGRFAANNELVAILMPFANGVWLRRWTVLQITVLPILRYGICTLFMEKL